MFLKRTKPAGIKREPASGADPRPRRELGVALGMVVTVLLAVRLGLPGAVEPKDIPFPELETSLLRRQLAERQGLRAAAHSHRLPLSVRAVGELVRRAGRAEAQRDAKGFRHLATRLGKQVSAARTEGLEEGLLELRELQTELFEHAVAEWDGSLPIPAELTELGGGFAQHMQPVLATKRITLVPIEVAAAFRVRWTELVGLDTDPSFAPRANDLRLNARLRLRVMSSAPDLAGGEALLRTIDTLSQLDPDYPASFARGVVHYRGRAYKQAFDAFKAHLEAHPDGPWTLRAQNHAMAAAEALLGVN